jgi:hypothetical protein
VRRVVSGAQTGVDRAALDAALELGLPCGGWVPRGRIDEAGRIPDAYPGLEETASADWDERTEANVRDSDATLLISRGPLTGGSLFTRDAALRLGRPTLHLDLRRLSLEQAAEAARRFIEDANVGVLNVAGPRASKDPGLHGLALRLLRDALG